MLCRVIRIRLHKNLRTYIWIYMMNDDDQLQNHYLKVMRMVRLKCQNQRQLQPGRLGAERGSPVDASAKIWTCHGLGMWLSWRMEISRYYGQMEAPQRYSSRRFHPLIRFSAIKVFYIWVHKTQIVRLHWDQFYWNWCIRLNLEDYKWRN